jgi:hypothetical protein
VSPPRAQALLVDAPGQAGRTTATLLASLASRLGSLYLVSGADAVGSLAAGFAALGRAVSETAEGARLRRALERSRVGANGDAVWTALRIREWVSSLPPAPVLDQLRNDVALVLADDLLDTLGLMPIPGEPAGASAAEPAAAEFVELVLGLWAFSRELVAAVEELAAPTLPPAGSFAAGAAAPGDPEGELLR